MSSKPIQEGRFKSTVKKKTVKNIQLIDRLVEELFRTGALLQIIRASSRLRKKVKFCRIFSGKLAKKNRPISQKILSQFFGQISLKLI